MSSFNKTVSLSTLINPSPKQREFFEAIDTHKYVLYGGAKGGGKSYSLRWALIKLLLKWAQEGHQGVTVMLACEDYPSLKSRQATKIQTEFPAWLGRLSDNQIHGLSFILHKQYGGGIIALRNLDDPSKYASSEFAAVAIDELTKNTEEVFSQFRSIMRWPGIDHTKFLAGTNPGGVGHHWVRKYWVDRDFPDLEPEPEQFFFVQAFAKDNPFLSEEYVKSLQGLPEALRKAYLEGSWDVYEGQFFDEWREEIHTIPSFTIPSGWRKFRCIDHGRRAPTACIWGAVDYDGRIYVYREYYERGLDADVNAKNIKELSKGDGKYWFTVLDSACFARIGAGETIAEIYERNGLPALPSPKDRKAGWALFHEYLRPPAPDVSTDLPHLVFFKNCPNCIRTIPTLQYADAKDGSKIFEDLDTNGEDHAADALSYALQFMHESKSVKESADPLAKMLKKNKKRNSFSPRNLNKYYSGKQARK